MSIPTTEKGGQPKGGAGRAEGGGRWHGGIAILRLAMIDQKTIELIVQRVVERLLADPRFLAAAGGGRTGSAPPPPVAVQRHFGRLLSEWDILTLHRSGRRAVAVARGTIVTPMARDRARDLGVELLVE